MNHTQISSAISRYRNIICTIECLTYVRVYTVRERTYNISTRRKVIDIILCREVLREYQIACIEMSVTHLQDGDFDVWTSRVAWAALRDVNIFLLHYDI